MMHNLSIVKKASSAEVREIEQYETLNKVSLPESFKKFLIELNPIDTHERVIRKENKLYSMDRFFPFDEKNDLSFQVTNDNLKEFFESKYLTFGCDAGGWQFVLSVHEADYGRVYFCRMDEALEDALTLLAENFEEFIEILEVE